MLRKLLIILFIFVSLSACSSNTNAIKEDSTFFTILAGKDVSSFSLVDCISNPDVSITVDDDIDYKLEFNKADYDFILAPFVDGVENCGYYDNYKALAIITYGDYYIVSPKPLAVGVIFGEPNNNVKTILPLMEADFRNYTIDFSYNYQAIEEYLLNDTIIACVKEPYLTILENKYKDKHDKELIVLKNVQDSYYAISSYNKYPDYCLFIKNDTYDSRNDSSVAFIGQLKQSIININADKTKIINSLDKYVIDDRFTKNTEKEVFSNINLSFDFVSNNLDIVNTYLEYYGLDIRNKYIH